MYVMLRNTPNKDRNAAAAIENCRKWMWTESAYCVTWNGSCISCPDICLPFLYISFIAEKETVSLHLKSVPPNLCAGQMLMSGGQRVAVQQPGMPQVSSVMEDEILMDLI